MSILLNTTGVVSSVTINDLGGVLFTHPVSSYNLTNEWSYEELQGSDDLGSALDAGYISITNAGFTVATSVELKLVQPQPNTDVAETIHFSTIAPVVGDDNTLGYFAGQRWINTVSLRSYIAISVATGAAVWREITPPSGISTGTDGELQIVGGLTLGTAITPPSLTANTDNLLITGIEKAIVVRLSINGNYTLSGIVPFNATKAWMIYVCNVGNDNITLQDNAVGSTAQNRFLIGGNKVLQKDEGVLLFYDTVSTRWRAAGINI